MTSECEFARIEFGLSDAERERTTSPNLLIDGFLDEQGYIDKILNNIQFLVLGPKGSGKSAIGAKIFLMSENSDNNLSSHLYSLNDFSYHDFDKLYNSDDSYEIRYPRYWEFLLLLSVIDNVSRDNEAIIDIDNISLDKVVKDLRNIKLLPPLNMTDIVKSTPIRDFVHSISEFSINLSLGNVGAIISGKKSKSTPSRDEIYNVLKRACMSIKTTKKHILILDDLDYVFIQDPIERDLQFKSLMALITATDRLNNEFQLKKVNIKIVVLCRTDIFNNLSGTNKAKIERDCSINLDWNSETRDTKNINLVKLINLRAKTSLKKDVDVFKSYFPYEYQDNKSIREIIDWTRYLPRDIIQLMNDIKKSVTTDKLNYENICDGRNEYAIKYLLPEINDGLTGFLKSEHQALAFKLLSSMGKRNFRFTELIDKAESDYRFSNLNSNDLNNICSNLYNCGAIGTYYEDGNGHKRYSYIFRNRNSSFDNSRIITIHIGVAKALNINLFNNPVVEFIQ